MVGLSDFSTNHSSKYVNIDYAFYPHGGKAYQIYESGSIRRKSSSVSSWGGYSNTTIFTITYDNQYVRYFVNGSLIRSVSAGANRKFAVYASCHNTGTLTTMLSFMPMAQRGQLVLKVQLDKEVLTGATRFKRSKRFNWKGAKGATGPKVQRVQREQEVLVVYLQVVL